MFYEKHYKKCDNGKFFLTFRKPHFIIRNIKYF